MYKSLLNDCRSVSLNTSDFEEIVNPYLLHLFTHYFSHTNGETKVLLQEVPIEFLNNAFMQFADKNSVQYHETVLLFLKFHLELAFLFEHLTEVFNSNNNKGKEFNRPLNWINLWRDKEEIEKYKCTFSSNVEYNTTALYPLLIEFDNSIKERFSKKEYFHIYFLSLLLNDSLSFSLKDEEWKYLTERWEVNFRLLNETATAAEKSQYWLLTGSFYGLHQEISDSLLKLDSLIMRNSIIESRWLKTFGEEVKLKELLYQKKLLEMQITLKNQDKDGTLTQSDCLRQGKIELLKEQEELQRLIHSSVWAKNIDIDSLFKFIPHDSPEFEEYRLSAERYFRLAVKLCHPDRRQYLLNGKTISKELEEELNNLYKQVIEIRAQKAIDPLDLISGDYFSIKKLKRIVAKAEMILSASGIIMSKVRLIIFGEDIKSQLAFLSNEHALLTTELSELHAKLTSVFSDEEAFRKNQILKDPDTINTVEQRYKEEIKACELEIENLRDEFKKLFKE